MEMVTGPIEMQQRALTAKRAGQRISFVPTMGFLHDGHLSLLQEGRKRGDLLVLSIFVNPTQFGANEDLSTYPRALENDSELARVAGTDLVFAPSSAAIYPPDASTWVNVEGLTDVLCGASRPGHFRGVTTVVAKLFNLVQPDVALFGCKDFQQLAVIRRMVRDLDIPVEIVGMPIVREADGLALSSRNVYLTPDERQQALVLSRAIATARKMAGAGERDAGEIVAALRALIAAQPAARIDYLQICHQDTLQEQTAINRDSVLLLAVFIGKTRLIDNSFLL
ncbi:MAG: pantoate--beta-alanine ligase [Deltaproteobacteria bacterium HGW-Deltaproteobacteria-4]|nr:MAG: pantoate--beta-alanine ligase [Deltaproteobacteria bacterium HGW-Deltaproteobacteria-4]